MDKEKFTIKNFFDKFSKSGLNKDFTSVSKFKKHQKIDYKRYRSIIKNYFKIYFYEAYFLEFDLYFFFGGKFKKVSCGSKFAKQKTTDNKLIEIPTAVGFFWYLRPCARFWFSFKVKKMIGSTNIIPQIEKEWKSENDVTLLPNYGKAIKQYRLEKKLFNL